LTLHKLDSVMNGDLEELIDQLSADDQARRLTELS
jgi:peptide chain release factor 1